MHTSPDGRRELAHIDPSVLDAIRSQMPNNPAIIVRIIDAFLQHSPHLLTRLRDALQVNDAEAVREAAHAMKSSNAQVGAHRLAGLCHQLELLGAMGQLPDRETLLTELQEEYQGVMHEMELLRARIPGTTER